MSSPAKPRAEDFLELVERGKRGRLKLYIGFAAGVGKTYRMLEEAHALGRRGVDIVVGFVETHGRAETAALLDGLDVVPRRRVEYRGVDVEEMSLNNILKRKPAVAIVDELAHTNVPGSRHNKRYQDVIELLDAGINVIGAFNVQHLESLKDIVERVTGVVIRETVPDSFLKQADQVVNLDLAVEDLQERLHAGKIYAADKVPWALEHFFKGHNLQHLRELALREVAESVERAGAARPILEQAGGAREGRGAPSRIMVCLSSSSPRGATLVRKGSRLAGRLNTDWFVAFVETPREAPEHIDAEAQRHLMASSDLAREMGAEVVRLKGRDPVGAILEFARSHSVGHIVVGRSQQAAWRQWLGRLVPMRLVREAAGVDVHVVATDDVSEEPGGRRVTLRGKLVLAQVPLAVGLVIVGVVSSVVTTRLGERSRLILADNYRSVLAAQRMKESLERMDGTALFALAGHAEEAAPGLAHHRELFDREIAVQEGNITEQGEAEVTARLRTAWDDYKRALASYEALPDRASRDAVYLARLRPGFTRVKRAAEEILALNQDAMVRKSDRAEERAHLFEHIVVVAVVLALALGLIASTLLTTRILRPLGVVAAAVRRFGEGDLAARATVEGSDEIAAVAGEFNRMGEKLQRYRASTLGELLQAQQAAQAAIDSLPDPVLLLDADGKLNGANTAATALLRIDPEVAAGGAFAGADPGVRPVVDRLRAHVLGGRGAYVPRGFEDALHLPIAADSERVFLPRATPIYGEAGAVSGAAIVFQDATKLFRFDELKNNLVATVAHELRTPLTSMRMAIHLCTEEVAGPLTAKQADLLFAAREDCERLQVIVDDLLNLSRIESGHIDLQRRLTAPLALVEAAVVVHRATADQARVALETEVWPGLPEVFVDPERLQLVFSNLIANAIRYSPAGSNIVLRAKPEAASADAGGRRAVDPDHVRFEVQDAGPGIAPEHQAGLFEKFFRVPGSSQGGSGLGLFIAKGLVQAHGGRIGVDSVVGRGATFWFVVPVAAPTSTSLLPGPAPSLLSSSP